MRGQLIALVGMGAVIQQRATLLAGTALIGEVSHGRPAVALPRLQIVESNVEVRS